MNDIYQLNSVEEAAYVPVKEDFTFTQAEVVIHDKEMESKPTTFAKDAFRRFCKNKSSVVGAIIIAILILLAIVVPIFSSYDVKGPHPYETFLRPKVFASGTGFWDGTKKYKGIAYDEATQLPFGGFSQNAISNLNIYEVNGVKFCDFVYDIYEEKYGIVEMILPNVYMEEYIEKGWVQYDMAVGDSSFAMLSDRSPVREVVSSDGGKIVAKVSMYRYLGYSTQPKYIFGTDDLGHDLVKLSFNGLRYSLMFAILVASVCFCFGLVWGCISGYFGGNVDLFMERFMDILGGVPMIVVVTLFRLHCGDSLLVFGASLCLTGWMGTAARTRTQFYRFKGREYVLASRTLGASDWRLIFKHILPNSLGTIVTSSVLMIPGLIFTETTLAYLGLGLSGGNSFGAVLSKNQSHLGTYPALIIFPAIIISLLMICFNLFGNGLRDALNPSLKGSE